MHRRRLRKFAKFLREEVPRKRFDMSTWAEAGFENNACGTSACALGWATVCFPRSGFEIEKADPNYPEEGASILRNGLYGFDAAVEFFGFDQTTEEGFAYDLFHGDDCTPKQKAKEIENLLAS